MYSTVEPTVIIYNANITTMSW